MYEILHNALRVRVFNLNKSANNKIGFDYDVAGNQIKRYLCINCLTTTEKTADVKQIDSFEKKDLQKFYSKDVI